MVQDSYKQLYETISMISQFIFINFFLKRIKMQNEIQIEHFGSLKRAVKIEYARGA